MVNYRKKVCKSCGELFKPRGPRTKWCDKCKTRVCGHCGKTFFLAGKWGDLSRGKYCSSECYFKARWGDGEHWDKIICPECGKYFESMKGNHRRFCSKICYTTFQKKNRGKYPFKPSPAYLRKKMKYIEKKLKLLIELGGKCIVCGNNDIRVLDFHHIDHSKKTIKTTSRAQSRYSDYEKEKDNLEILCSNCHRIKTWDELWKKQEYAELAEAYIHRKI